VINLNPKQFLVWGGVILVVVGVLGFFLIGPTAEQSIFGSGWWFDNAENWTHIVIGVVALLAAYTLPAAAQKTLAMVVGAVAVLIGLYSFIISQSFLGANLENPADSLLHVVVGAWALYASMSKGSSMPSGGMGNPQM